MNKGDLVEAVASELNTNKTEAAKAVEAVLSCIAKGVKTDGKVSIVGFGSFIKRDRAARTMNDPRTGKPIQVAASSTCAFKPSELLKGSL